MMRGDSSAIEKQLGVIYMAGQVVGGILGGLLGMLILIENPKEIHPVK
jgi:hypothetical protein